MPGALIGLALMLAMQDAQPLAGKLPPLPPARSASDGSDRPHGKLFISPMGEPFRGPDPIGAWFEQADTDHDGVLTRREFEADAARFFAVLDRGKDGEIDPDDIEYYETRLAPEIGVAGTGGGAVGGGGGRARGGGGGGGRRGGGGGGGGGHRGGGGGGGGGSSGGSGDSSASSPKYTDVRRGAALYGFFDYPEPVTVADTNFNRGVDPNEFKAAADARFDTLDKKHDGKITRGELPHLDLPDARPGRGGSGRGDWKSLRGRGQGDSADRPPPKDGDDSTSEE
jgi:Ca2+-binding EF-hand superfamily protein